MRAGGASAPPARTPLSGQRRRPRVDQPATPAATAWWAACWCKSCSSAWACGLRSKTTPLTVPVKAYGAFADLPVVGPERDLATGARFGRVALEEHIHGDVAGGDRLRGDLLEGVDAQERVGVGQEALLVDPKRVAADEVGTGDDHALGAAAGDVQSRLDGLRASLDAGRHAALDVLHVAGQAQPGDGRQRRPMRSPTRVSRPPSTSSKGCCLIGHWSSFAVAAHALRRSETPQATCTSILCTLR